MEPDHNRQRYVTLLLRGGHRWVCDLGPDGSSPAGLEQFLQQASGDGNAVIHLQSPEGQWLAVRTGEIVGVVAGADERGTPAPELTSANTLPGSPFIVIENFLADAEFAQVLSLTLARESAFSDATVTTAEAGYRHAKVVYEPADIRAVVIPKIEAVLPKVFHALNIVPPAQAGIECQLTAHGDGDFFKLHNDNGSASTAGRTVTYVYYFNCEPKRFSGGQLRLYETVVADGFYKCGTATLDIEPRRNRLLMFPSQCHHEVRPVTCASGKFEDRRFTLNGWFVRRL